MATLGDITVDCVHPASIARFWAAALEGYEVAPYDAAELERLRSMGLDDPEDDPSVLVQGPEARPRLWFQRVPEPKTVKNRVHLDLRADDITSEVARLVSLGAVVVEERDDDFHVMRDPEGNEFCIEPRG